MMTLMLNVKDRYDDHGCRNDHHERHDRHNHYMAMLIIARLLSGHACETPGHMRVTEKHDRTTSNPNAESYHVCLAAESLKSTAATPMSQRIHSGTTRGRKVGNTKHTCGHLCTRASGCRTALLHYGMFDKVALTSPTSSQMLSPGTSTEHRAATIFSSPRTVKNPSSPNRFCLFPDKKCKATHTDRAGTTHQQPSHYLLFVVFL